MKHTHTQGQFPLHAETSGEQIAIVTNQGNLYAKTFDPSAALLIAAAPEMLEALQMLLPQEPRETDSYDRAMWDNARAAIAKAIGKEDA